jgi:hypothetical protein
MTNPRLHRAFERLCNARVKITATIVAENVVERMEDSCIRCEMVITDLAYMFDFLS